MKYQENMRRFRPWKLIFIPFAIAAVTILVGGVVMWLWNTLMPPVFGLGLITFWQAIGLLVLSKILFGSFRGGYGCRGRNWGGGHTYGWRNKWMNMSEEDKARFKERCQNWERPRDVEEGD